MRFLELREQFKNFIVFSLTDIKKIEPGFYRHRLNDWQDKGYIKKIIKGYYLFSDQEIDERVLFLIANKIYRPSYISLEAALSYYHLIPESTYGITSIATKKTSVFKTLVGDFNYRSVKPKLFFGYNLVDYLGQKIKIADPVKTMIDFFYLNPHIKKEADFSELRINREELLAQWNQEKANNYLAAFNNHNLSQRIKCLI